MRASEKPAWNQNRPSGGTSERASESLPRVLEAQPSDEPREHEKEHKMKSTEVTIIFAIIMVVILPILEVLSGKKRNSSLTRSLTQPPLHACHARLLGEPFHSIDQLMFNLPSFSHTHTHARAHTHRFEPERAEDAAAEPGASGTWPAAAQAGRPQANELLRLLHDGLRESAGQLVQVLPEAGAASAPAAGQRKPPSIIHEFRPSAIVERGRRSTLRNRDHRNHELFRQRRDDHTTIRSSRRQLERPAASDIRLVHAEQE